jgi:hypothetical protein
MLRWGNLGQERAMSDWTPTVAAFIAVTYFLLFPSQFKELLAWLIRVFS